MENRLLIACYQGVPNGAGIAHYGTTQTDAKSSDDAK